MGILTQKALDNSSPFNNWTDKDIEEALLPEMSLTEYLELFTTTRAFEEQQEVGQ